MAAKEIVVVAAGPDLDVTSRPDFETALEVALETFDSGDLVVVDLSHVEFIDSTGLSCLVAALNTSEARDAAGIRLRGVSARVRRVLEITYLDGVLPIEDPEDE